MSVSCRSSWHKTCKSCLIWKKLVWTCWWTCIEFEIRLRRMWPVDAWQVCPNCLKEESLGFSAVCTTFKTWRPQLLFVCVLCTEYKNLHGFRFICSDCKSAHQSFSHRCKSIQMSVWTMEEVKVGKADDIFFYHFFRGTWIIL